MTELEALSLGMSIVQEVADEELRLGAKTLHEKIASHALNRRKSPEAWGFGLYEFKRVRDGLKFMPTLRHAIRNREVLRIGYHSLSDKTLAAIHPAAPDGLLGACLDALGMVRDAQRFPLLSHRPHHRL